MAAEEQPSSLARKLNRLFETSHPAGRGEYSPEEVAKVIADSGEGSISPAYIYMLRKGQRDNPTKRHLELLAGFFGVTPAYFFDEEAAERIEQQLDLLAAFRDSNVRRLAARASGLSLRSLTSILQMVDAARELEGLTDPQEQEGEDTTARPSQEDAQGHWLATNYLVDRGTEKHPDSSASASRRGSATRPRRRR